MTTMSDKTNDETHMTPFLEALYECVRTHGPDDNLEVLRDLLRRAVLPLP